MGPWIHVVYRVRSDAKSVERRARVIATEQSVEMPLEAIADKAIHDNIVGKVEGISDLGGGLYEVRIALARATFGKDAGQVANMLFGNTSLHEDTTLYDADLPPDLLGGGPNGGLAALRARVRAANRALTCSALKPQGLSPEKLGDLAAKLARGGLDYIKDDHGLADQDYSPFATRVAACARAVRQASEAEGHVTCYAPSLSGNLEQIREQVRIARDNGVSVLLIAPMIAGLSNMQALVRDNRDMLFLSHPSLAGSTISPVMLAKLFRLTGADGVVFPSFGGRFGYSRETCREIAQAGLKPWGALAPAVPVPAGGMTLERVPELLGFYGTDVMLLIGGNLLLAGEKIVEETRRFTTAVAGHR